MDSAFDNRAESGCPSDPAQYGQRCARRNPACTRHNDDGNCIAQIAGQPEGERGCGKRKINQIARKLIGKFLDRSAGVFSRFHRFNNPSIAGIAAHTLNHDFKRTALIDGSGIDLTANLLIRGHGFPRDTGLIHRALSGNHAPINRGFFTGGKQHSITGHNRLDSKREDLSVAAYTRFCRNEINQIFNGRASTRQRDMFQLFSNQHKQAHHKGCEIFGNGGGSKNCNAHG